MDSIQSKAMSFDPPRFLQAGDVVQVEIDGIGVSENRFVEQGMALHLI